MDQMRALLLVVAVVGLSACSAAQPPVVSPTALSPSILELETLAVAEGRRVGIFASFRDDLRPFFAGQVEPHRMFDALIMRVRTEADLPIVDAEWPSYRALAWWRYFNETWMRRSSSVSHDSAQTFTEDAGGRWSTLEERLLAVWAPPPPPPPPAPPPPLPPEARTGLVRSAGSGTVSDDQGVFVAVGTTFFAAVHFERTDPARLDAELAEIRSASNGAIDYVRILGALGGDCDNYWREIRIDPTDAQYRQWLGRTIDRVYDRHGMRVALTIFGGDCWDHPRRATIDDVLAVISTRVDKVILVETSNEAWQTEYDGEFDALRADSEYLAARTAHLVAPTASFSGECEFAGGHEELYAGLAVDLFTAHYARDTDTGDGFWRPVRQPWGSLFCSGIPIVMINGEPIGPGSSVDSDDDPLRLVGGAIVSFFSDHSFHTIHTTAGVRNDTRFADVSHLRETFAAIAAMKDYLPPDVVAWSEQNHHWSTGGFQGMGHPFERFQIIETDGPPGVIRGYAVVKNGCEFKVLPMGIQGGVRLRAKADMIFDLIDPLTGAVLSSHRLDRGQSTFVSDQQEAVWVSGRCR